jgi:hypothetical protein
MVNMKQQASALLNRCLIPNVRFAVNCVRVALQLLPAAASSGTVFVAAAGCFELLLAGLRA